MKNRMLKLLSTSDFYSDEVNLKRFDKLKKRFNFDGFELIKFNNSKNNELKDVVKGFHLRFFPMWIDLYLGKKFILEREIENENDYKFMCGGKNVAEMLSYYSEELELAHSLNVKYVVLHACNIRISETFSYNFQYSDMEVLKAVVKIINQLFLPKYNFKLLLENLWWPGLKLNSKNEIEFLINNIKYKNLGFMLDTGHLLNNNIELKNIDDGVEYIKNCIKNLGEYKKYIRGVHLNYSLSGEYVKESLRRNKNLNLFEHIGKIDYHNAFEHREIKNILDDLKLDYLVYELIAKNDEELESKIIQQEMALNNLK